MSKLAKRIDVCDTMRVGEHYKIFGTDKSFRSKGMLFTLKFENGCLDERVVEKIKGFTTECRDLQYYAISVTGSVYSKNLQMVLKVVTKAMCTVAAIKKLYKPLKDGGTGTCDLTVRAVPKKKMPSMTVLKHLGKAFELSIIYSDGLSISQNHYNNGTTACTNLYGFTSVSKHLKEEYKLSIEARFEDFLLAQARSNAPKKAQKSSQNSVSNITKRYNKLYKECQCHEKTIATLKSKNEALKAQSTDNLKKANEEINRLKQQLTKRPREPEVIEYQQPAPKKSKCGKKNWYRDGLHECGDCKGKGDMKRHDCAKGKGVESFQKEWLESDDY